ncbi:MAG: DUF547 domain-containing protein [Acidobacteriota bacterium]
MKILLYSLAITALAVPAFGETFSHDRWGRVLQEFVNEEGLVDYQALSENRGDLDAYIAQVQKYSPESHPEMFPTRDHELAYYLNAYNAQIFLGVLREDIPSSVWGFLGIGHGFFVGMDITIGGRKTNLKKLEDVDIREGYEDPRIHAALNCASISCPRLPREPFLPDALQAQLDAAMTEFVTTSRGFDLDREDQEVHLSKIFDWFEGDFLAYEKSQGSKSPNLIDYVNRYRGSEPKIPADYDVEFLPYDKDLNSQ